MSKVVKNKLIGCPTVELDSLLSLQGKLKKSKPEVLLKLRNSLTRKGMVFPLFVWPDADNKVNWLLDGVHRVICLRELRDMGYKIDPVPVIPIKAKSKFEAKKIILLASSHYSIITKKGFNAFAESMNLDKLIGELHFSDIKLEFHVLDDDVKDIDNNVQFIYSKSELKELQECLQGLRDHYGLAKDTDIIFKALETHKTRLERGTHAQD